MNLTKNKKNKQVNKEGSEDLNKRKILYIELTHVLTKIKPKKPIQTNHISGWAESVYFFSLPRGFSHFSWYFSSGFQQKINHTKRLDCGMENFGHINFDDK